VPEAKIRSSTTGAETAGPDDHGRLEARRAPGPDHRSRQDQDRGQGQAAYQATELAAGVRTPSSYTVGQCLKDWLETLNTQAEITVTGYRTMARHLIGLIGSVELVDLKVRACRCKRPGACDVLLQLPGQTGIRGWPR
jgi:hypothetical protein